FSGRSGQLAVQDPSLQRCLALDRDEGNCEALKLARQEHRGRPASLEPIETLVHPKRETRGRAARKIERRAPAPPCPATLAGKREIDGAFDPEHRWKESMGGGDDAGAKVELVPVGLGVEMKADLVAAVGNERLEFDKRSP